ncbi:hypothetical protein TrVE_jg1668 [Triparma verrucosa]|uniref:Uncharacterized protein n=1 Tax=Triparma verrucosa TaxID=1606542 RepID=A0A9W7FII8_9STRA|nr:hypothetical protein TrVE_jg1668 [Triparma verrucosa]
MCSRLTIAIASTTTAFWLKLNQKCLQLEWKRLKSDIRNCTASEVHLLVPRVNAFLLEMTQMCDSTHKFFFAWTPTVVQVISQLAVCIFFLNVKRDTSYEVPAWIIVAQIQSILNLISFYWGYANLNRLVERDIDHDLSTLRLKFR